ncbi:PTS sugar transporter subunit IIA [Salimicrobium halophilum]|uniref:PTS system IIA component, Gat family n=1 Tax=Salimicrobium halophilum TaxID=86666 RepID=A0A1G8UZC9_9BACI|nr:PTS sugar transporter subunit IIA [Salimicrobium halophilum]SDJ58455.1 PTS system IIA component, Gat family [Salimicrobium halophilum]
MGEIRIEEEVIFQELEASSKEEALRKVAGNLVEQKIVEESFVEAVIEREKEFATGLPTPGLAVAIPHTDAFHVREKAISVAVLKEPVTFIQMGTRDVEVPVKIMFMLAMNEAHSQLELLQKLMAMLQKQEVLEGIVSAETATAIRKMMEEELGLYNGQEK